MQPTDSDFIRELMTLFCAEADERLATIDLRLVALEEGPEASVAAELLADLMRELHTLKGSAGAVNLPDVSRLAHALEGLFATHARGSSMPADVFDRGYCGLDAIKALIAAAARGDAPMLDVDAALARVAGVAPAPETFDGSALAAPDPAGATVLDAVPVDPSPATQPLPVAAGGIATASGVGPEHVAAISVEPVSPNDSPLALTRLDGAEEVVRVATSKLDSLMARVGELVVARSGAERRTGEVRELLTEVGSWEESWCRVRPMRDRLRALVERDEVSDELAGDLERLLPMLDDSDERLRTITQRLAELRAALDGDDRRMGQVTGDLEDEVRKTRMVAVASMFDPMHRLVRDLARDLGKEVALEVQGGETEVDRAVIEQIRGPLTHLVRNALDHGIEAPHERERAGKPRRATLRLAAAQRGGALLLAISDDGAGIEVGRVRDAALAAGVVSADQLRAMSERDLLRLVFRPNFSTSTNVSDVSGRGVGLDVVRETAERLNGMVEVSSDAGTGTTFTLSLPLSVATTQVLLVQVAGRDYALPVGAVTRIVAVEPSQIGRAQGREMMVLDDGPVLLVRLEDALQLPSDERAETRRPVIVLNAGDRRIGIAVDGLVGTQDVVVKPLPPPFQRVRHAAGATVLASGEVVVVLNTSDLVRAAARTASRIDRPAGDPTGVSVVTAPGATRRQARILVVDDSIVTRMLEKSILEAAGHAVTVAADGGEALRIAQVEPPDLVISDVNMPTMDGLALTQAIRGDVRLRDTPVILVTSLDAEGDQARGMQAGADAYIVKSSFSQDGLLEAVGRLLPAIRVAS